MSSRQNIDPRVWGPPAWKFIDYVVMSYPESATLEQQIWMSQFVTSLGDALPCEKCRVNFKRFLGMNPVEVYVTSRSRLSYWFKSYRGWSKS